MGNPKISVLVPVYNVEKYLPSCLDSILAQSLQDIEVICVDDGSTDASGRILDDYAGKDARIKVLHRQNKGYGAAMNAGLDEATGEYIGIVESDDRIEPEMYRVLYEYADREHLDVVKSDPYYWMESVNYKQIMHEPRLIDYYDRVLEDGDRKMMFEFLMNIWTGIYRRKFLVEHQIRFHETPGASYQDNGFWIQTLVYCKRAMWLKQSFYLYRQDNPAASVKSRDKIMTMTDEYDYIEQLMKDRNDEQGLWYCNYFRIFRHKGTFLRISDEYKRDFGEFVKKDYEAYKNYALENRNQFDWCRQMCEDPDRACDCVVLTKLHIREKLLAAKHIVIYGAGRRGRIVLKGLYNEGFYDKISCFAVSEAPQEDAIANKEVMQIRDAIKKFPDALVIVAVIRSTGAYAQMAAVLHELGIFEFLDATDFETNYFIM